MGTEEDAEGEWIAFTRPANGKNAEGLDELSGEEGGPRDPVRLCDELRADGGAVGFERDGVACRGGRMAGGDVSPDHDETRVVFAAQGLSDCDGFRGRKRAGAEHSDLPQKQVAGGTAGLGIAGQCVASHLDGVAHAEGRFAAGVADKDRPGRALDEKVFVPHSGHGAAQPYRFFDPLLAGLVKLGDGQERCRF